jgi:outer membrane protein
MHKKGFKQLLSYFLILIVSSCAYAQDDYSIRLYHGQVTSNNFGQILSGETNGWKHDLRVTSVDAGYLLAPSFFELPIDLYLKSGFSYFDESNVQNDIYELTLYVKAYWNIDFLKNRLRVGFGEGLSYTSGILTWEHDEALRRDDNEARLLNYLDVSVDLDLGRLLNCREYHGVYIGWAIKHRSGIKNVLGDVEHSGSNYTGLYIESNF